MEIAEWKRKTFVLGIFGPLQYIVLLIIAMIFYPGGTQIDPLSPGYSFTSNYLSDLGMVVAYNGMSNTISMILFIIAMVIAAIMIPLLFLNLIELFKQSNIAKRLGMVGFFFQILYGIGLIGTGLSPQDINWDGHFLFAAISYMASVLSIIFFSSAIFKVKNFSNKYGILLLAVAIFNIIGIITAFVGPPVSTTPELLQVYGTLQKLMGYSGLIVIIFVAYEALKQTSSSIK